MIFKTFCGHHFSFPLLLGDDFSQNGTIVTVPANRQIFQIPHFLTIVDDNINEDEQSFVIVAEIGDDVPDKFANGAKTGFYTLNISCFQLEGDCRGRRGATEIRIDDNDRKLYYH